VSAATLGTRPGSLVAAALLIWSLEFGLLSADRIIPDGPTILHQLVTQTSPDLHVQVANLYESVAYKPVWFEGSKLTIQAAQFIDALQHADAKGLDPADYEASRLTSSQPSATEIAQFDLALSLSAMRYVSDLNIGRVNPKLCQFGFDVEGKRVDLAAFLRERVIHAASVEEALRSAEPPYPGYWRLQKTLQTYLALAREDDGELLPSTRKPIDPGELYSGYARLARLLRRLGDLPPDAAVDPSRQIYDGALVDAVKRFQGRHGLDPDGRIGKTTLDQLNTPLSRRVRQLQLTLERWRWAPRAFATPPIVVNIPEFRLRSYDATYHSPLEMNVVVGKAYRHRTPVFFSDMRFVIFRPYWNVPRSIERAEITPKIEHDRTYAAKNGYEITDSRGQVIPGGVVSDQTLRQLRAGKLLIRQIPGPKNALGLVKFMFPNEHNVYMHDTPTVQLFSKPRRDFSHGCIRVEAPEELAVSVLKNNPEWTRERIREAMHGEKTIQVNLKTAIPVLIVYGTAVAPETGNVRFLPDIYGHDASLEKLLATSSGRGLDRRE